MNEIEVLKILNKNEDYNYVGTGLTVLHEIGLIATSNYLRNVNDCISGLILIKKHKITGRCIQPDMLQMENFEIVDYESQIQNKTIKEKFDSFFYGICSLLPEDQERVLYIVQAYNIDYSWAKYFKGEDFGFKIIYIEIDDGLASYSSRLIANMGYRRNIITDTQEIWIKSLLYSIFQTLGYYLMRNIGKLTGKYIDARIFVKKRGRFSKNDFICNHYIQAFKKAGEKYDFSKFQVLEGAIVINTQALYENNETDGQVDIELYREVIQILKQFDIPIVVKTHPREKNIKKYEEFDCIILESTECPQEVIFSNLEKKPLCLISICSSTLLNCSKLFGIKAISLAKLLLDKKYTSGLNKLLKADLKGYIRQYRNSLSFPKTINEFNAMICGLEK